MKLRDEGNLIGCNREGLLSGGGEIKCGRFFGLRFEVTLEGHDWLAKLKL